jgi:hypothetical protein
LSAVSDGQDMLGCEEDEEEGEKAEDVWLCAITTGS